MPDDLVRDQLAAALAADPLNAGLRLIFADCLEERGDVAAALRHRTIAGLPPAPRGVAVAAVRFVETTLRPAALALTLAAALTFLDPSLRLRLDRGELQAD